MSSVKPVLALASTIACLLGAAAPAASADAWSGQQPLFGTGQRVSSEGFDLDVARDGHAVVAGVDASGADRLMVATRTPTGDWVSDTVARPRHPDTDRGSQYTNAVDVAVAPGGHAAVLFARETDGAYQQLWLTEKPAGASAWTAPAQITSGGSQKFLGGAAFDSTGRLLVVFGFEGINELRSMSRAAGDPAFGEPVPVLVDEDQDPGTAPVQAYQGDRLAVELRPVVRFDSNDRAIVAWSCNSVCVGFGRPHVALATGDEGAAALDPATVVAAPAGSGGIATTVEVETNAGGDAVLLARVGEQSNAQRTVAVVARDGEPFGAASEVSPLFDGTSSDQDVALAPDGSVLAVWRAYQHGDVQAYARGASFLAAGSTSWVTETTPPPFSGVDQHVRLASDWAGRPVAVWTVDLGASSSVTRWSRRSDGPGGSWSAPADIVGASTGPGLLQADGSGDLTLVLRHRDASTDGAQAVRMDQPAPTPPDEEDPDPTPADTAAPTVTITAPTAGQRVQQGAAITATYRCEDGIAIAMCTPLDVGGHTCEVGAKRITCSGPLDTSTAGERQLRVRAKDAAGLETLTGVGYTVVATPPPPPDTTAPSIDLTIPRDRASYYQGLPVNALYTCGADAVSCSGTVPSGQRFATKAGTQRFTVTATDAAGNRAERSVTFTVLTPAQVNAPLPPALKAQAKPATEALKKVPTTASSGGLLKNPPKLDLSGLQPGSLTSVGAEALQRGGSVVAAGGGNVVAAGGGNVIAAGGGNVVAAGGGNVVAAGGGNVVAAGGGNVVAAGGGNVVAPGGANVVAGGGGNLIARASAAVKPKVILLAKAVRTVPASGKVSVRLQLTKAGKAALRRTFRRKGKQRVTVLLSVGTFVPGANLPATTVVKPITVKE
jgi:hypothetical protein